MTSRRTHLCLSLSLLLLLLLCFSLLPAQALAAGDFDTPRELEVLSESPAPVFRSSGEITVYFRDSWNWGTPYAYYWDEFGEIDREWPGKAMTFDSQNDYGQSVYRVTIPADVKGICFNRNGLRTVDITRDIVDGTMWYPTDQTDGSGHYYVGYVESSQPSEPASQPASQPASESTLEVAFVPDYSDYSGWIYRQVPYGSRLTRPDPNPVQEGFVFGGWYVLDENADWEYDDDGGWYVIYARDEQEGTEDTYSLIPLLNNWDEYDADNYLRSWDFSSDTVTKDIELFARWTPVTEPQTEYPTEPLVETEGYYLAGSLNNSTIDDAYKLTRLDESEVDEYILRNVQLTTDDSFKIVYSSDGSSSGMWYPEGMGNNYGENGEIQADGTYDVYFRPNYDGGEDWFYNCIYVVASEEPTEPLTEQPTQQPTEPLTEQPTELPTVEPQTEAYYLVGTMNGWSADNAYKLTCLDESEGDEYILRNVQLTTDDSFKILYSSDGSSYGMWYPEGMGNSFGENGEIVEDGTYDVYFRPNYDGGEDWFYNCIYVVASEEPTVQPNTITVYFVDNQYWGTPNIYYRPNGGEWLGVAMTFSEYNDYGEPVYKATIPAGTAGISFISNGNQTVDITSDIADGAMWYTTGYMNEDGRYIVNRAEHPSEEPTEQPTEPLTEQPSEEPVFGEPDFTLPKDIKSIEASAFESADMSVVYIPDGCESIGVNAFRYCTSLRQIRIPASVTTIDQAAFTGCENVVVFGAENSRAQEIAEYYHFTFIAENS